MESVANLALHVGLGIDCDVTLHVSRFTPHGDVS